MRREAMETKRAPVVQQSVPVKPFQTPDRLTVATPMAGILLEDIVVEVHADARLTIHGEPREDRKPENVFGVLPEPKEPVLNEWRAGGYHRELTLPQPVDGELATLTYGN